MSNLLGTPLAYLMDMLYIQGTQLAKTVHVDRTIISRWKNGRKELNMKSLYFSDVVNAILDINEEQGIKTLERFFSSSSGVLIETREELYESVVKWLISDDFEEKYKEPKKGNSLYNASYKIYKGASGKRSAILYLLEMANSLPRGESILLYDADSRFFHLESKKIQDSQKLFLEAQKKGHKLVSLFCLDKTADQIYNMFDYWMPIFISQNMEALYTYKSDNPFYNCICSIKGKLILVSSDYKKDKRSVYTAVYDEPLTVIQFDAFLEKYRKDFHPLFERFISKDMSEDFKYPKMVEYLKQDMNQYFNIASFPFVTANKKMIESVIFDEEMTPSEEKKVLHFYKNCNVYFQKILLEQSFTRVIFSLEYIQNLLPDRKVEIPELTSLLGRKIEISTQKVAKEIKNVMQAIAERPGIEIALVPLSVEPFRHDFNLWVKENRFIYFSNINNRSVRIFSDEFMTTNAFYSSIRDYWEQLPYEAKQIEWIHSQIDKVIEKMKTEK